MKKTERMASANTGIQERGRTVRKYCKEKRLALRVMLIRAKSP